MIIYGTGFDTQAMASSVEITGEGGQVLAEHLAARRASRPTAAR